MEVTLIVNRLRNYLRPTTKLCQKNVNRVTLAADREQKHAAYQGPRLAFCSSHKQTINRLPSEPKMQFDVRLRAKQDFADVVQTAQSQTHRYQQHFCGPSDRELYVWLKTVSTHNLPRLAQQNRTQQLDSQIDHSFDQPSQQFAFRIFGELSGDQTAPSKHMVRQERTESLADALSRLLENKCEATMLERVHDCQVAEITEHFRKLSESVAGPLRRGRKMYRNSIQETD